MVTYLMLLNWTDQGIKNVKDSPKRLDAVKKLAKDMGGEVKAFYLTMGPYDTVAVLTLPDDETMAALALSLGASGNVRTVTMRAFPEPEYREILRGVKIAT